MVVGIRVGYLLPTSTIYTDTVYFMKYEVYVLIYIDIIILFLLATVTQNHQIVTTRIYREVAS